MYRMLERICSIFEYEWPANFFEFMHRFYTISKKMIFCTELHKLRLPDVNNSDTVRLPKWPAKNGLYIAISFPVRRSEGGSCQHTNFEENRRFSCMRSCFFNCSFANIISIIFNLMVGLCLENWALSNNIWQANIWQRNGDPRQNSAFWSPLRRPRSP